MNGAMDFDKLHFHIFTSLNMYNLPLHLNLETLLALLSFRYLKLTNSPEVLRQSIYEFLHLIINKKFWNTFDRSHQWNYYSYTFRMILSAQGSDSDSLGWLPFCMTYILMLYNSYIQQNHAFCLSRIPYTTARVEFDYRKNPSRVSFV